MVGRPLSCDESTYNCIRLDYARVCVEVDASLVYVHEFEIESPLTSEPITVKVDYEWKPSRCEKCHIFGHSCPIAPAPPINKGKSPVNDVIPMPVPAFPIIQPPTNPSTSTQPPSPNDIPLPSLINSAPPQNKITDSPTPSLPPTSANHIDEPLSLQHIPTPIPTQIPLPPPVDTLPLYVENAAEGSTNITNPHQPVLNTTTCLENKMASLQSNSASSTACEDSTAETSTISPPFNESHDDSLQPSPKTARKKRVERNVRRLRAFSGCKFSSFQ
jgi:hypothetical protein